jgi:RNA polymerase primary sigma factor
MWERFSTGTGLEAIAGEFECSCDEARSILRHVQVRRWSNPAIEWVHNELFDAPGADEIILEAPAPPQSIMPAPRVPSDLPPYLRSLYLTPLLSAEEEQDLFRRYNYLKFKASKLFKALDSSAVSDREFAEIAELMKTIDGVRQRIIKANLRLVVSVAKKHVGWSPNFFEVISDGNMSLMRAVEKFDYARGYKFSTYGTWAIMKNFARSVPERHYHYARYVTGQEELLQTAPDQRIEGGHAGDREHVRQLIETGLQELTEREREIVSNHFGLSGEDDPMTLEQLGERYGVTKERVRQIEQRALARLRQVLSPTLADSIEV